MPIVISGTNGISGVDGTASNPSYEGTDANTGVFFPAADTIAFATAGTEDMRIDSSGNVGIGTTSPSTYGKFVTFSSGGYFSVDTNGQVISAQLLDVATAGGRFTGYSSRGALGSLDIQQTTTGADGGYMAFRTCASGSTTTVERMRIDSSGNVGIGTTSINTTLAVNGNALFGTGAWPINDFGRSGSRFVNASGTEDGILVVVNMQSGVGTNRGGFINLGARATTGVDGATFAQIGGIRENATSGNYSSALTFYTSASNGVLGERARIDSAGVMSIGTTGTNGGAKFYCYDSTASAAFIGGFRAANASYASADQVNWVDRSASSAYSFFVTRSNNDTDTEHNLRGDGNAYADGSWINNGADYAEFFESVNGQALTLGSTVVLDNNKVREATGQDPESAIIGVVRPKEPNKASMVIGNSAWNKWANKYLTDDFDCYIMEDHDVLEWTDEDGKQHSHESHNIPDGLTVPDDAVVKTHDDKGNKFQHYKLNPAWDKDAEYTPREHRPEWNIIGLIGQVKVLKGQPVNDRWIKMRDVSDTVEEWFIR